MKLASVQLCVALSGSICIAQQMVQSPKSLPPMNPLLSDDQPPGVIGAIQLKRNGALCGYMQPVELRGPEGVEFSFATDGFFGEPIKQPARVALMVGVPYRIKITGIPFAPEAELFPSIELIDRTYPPAEKAHRFPVPIEFAELEFDAARRGDLISRVVYLEDSANAEPVSYVGPQRIYEANPGEDMLQTADIYGRPLAIVKLGSRVPTSTDGMISEEFLFGSPPIGVVKAIPDAEQLYEQGIFQRYEVEPNAKDSQAFIQAKPIVVPELANRHAISSQRISDSK
jgi:hypothetical protein